MDCAAAQNFLDNAPMLIGFIVEGHWCFDHCQCLQSISGSEESGVLNNAADLKVRMTREIGCGPAH